MLHQYMPNESALWQAASEKNFCLVNEILGQGSAAENESKHLAAWLGFKSENYFKEQNYLSIIAHIENKDFKIFLAWKATGSSSSFDVNNIDAQTQTILNKADHIKNYMGTNNISFTKAYGLLYPSSNSHQQIFANTAASLSEATTTLEHYCKIL